MRAARRRSALPTQDPRCRAGGCAQVPNELPTRLFSADGGCPSRGQPPPFRPILALWDKTEGGGGAGDEVGSPGVERARRARIGRRGGGAGHQFLPCPPASRAPLGRWVPRPVAAQGTVVPDPEGASPYNEDISWDHTVNRRRFFSKAALWDRSTVLLQRRTGAGFLWGSTHPYTPFRIWRPRLPARATPWGSPSASGCSVPAAPGPAPTRRA
eukprot:scaffold1516_cov266-Prasinococcus_capsulatus_cf.AAC.8